ncbi:MAG TPA: chemotaxis protein CheB [Polyangia bacterium]|nr:chemotaxis protein CheB [Polyangia bacterium]
MGTARSAPFLPATDTRVGVARPGDHDIVVVGASVAAARTASMFLVGLHGGFSLPLVLLLGGPGRDRSDGERLVSLQAHCALPVRIVDDKDPILPGRIHVAPADYHLFIDDDHFALSTAAPVNGARPSIDVLFGSVADAFGPRAVCVLLGSNEHDDGRAGADRVRARGGLVIVENPATAALGVAPRAEAPLASATVLHLSEIAPFVSNLGEWEAS